MNHNTDYPHKKGTNDNMWHHAMPSQSILSLALWFLCIAAPLPVRASQPAWEPTNLGTYANMPRCIYLKYTCLHADGKVKSNDRWRCARIARGAAAAVYVCVCVCVLCFLLLLQ